MKEKDISVDETVINKNTEKNNKKPENGKSGLAAGILDWAETFVVALCAVILLFTFAFRVVTVDGDSMMNTLYNGEKLIITDLFYTPKTGDIIITSVPEHYGDNPLVKRVIATGGQTVDIDFENWIVTVDGEPLAVDKNGNPTNEPYVNYKPNENMAYGRFTEYPYKVPEGFVFVMGDNRNDSADSRIFGAVDERHVIGKVVFRALPLNRMGFLSDGQ